MTEALKHGVTLAWLEKLEFVLVATSTGRIYHALQATFQNVDNQKIVITTPNHPNAIRGLLVELGCVDFTKAFTHGQLQVLCGNAFYINSVWVIGKQFPNDVAVKSIQVMKRMAA